MLTDNYLGEAGALALAAALRSNTALRELHLKVACVRACMRAVL